MAQPGFGMPGGVLGTNSAVGLSGNAAKSANTAAVTNVSQSSTLTAVTFSGYFPNQVVTTSSAQIPSGVTLVGMFGQTPMAVPSAQTASGSPAQPVHSAGQAHGGVLSASSPQSVIQQKPMGGQNVPETLQAVGLVRPQQMQSLGTHQPVLTESKAADTQQGMVQGIAPLQSYYNPLTGTFMTALPGQTFMQGGMMPQGSVGNGLLMTALGVTPGRSPMQYVQPGILYGPQPSEMAQRQTDSSLSSGQSSMEAQKEQTEELASPEAKKLKLVTQVTS